MERSCTVSFWPNDCRPRPRNLNNKTHDESPITSVYFLTRCVASSIIDGVVQLRREKTISKSETVVARCESSLSECSPGFYVKLMSMVADRCAGQRRRCSKVGNRKGCC